MSAWGPTGRPGQAAAPLVAGVVLLAATAAAGALLVPWQRPESALVTAPEVFTTAELARTQAYLAAARPWAYLSLALGVAVPVLAATTPAGRRIVARATTRRWWVCVPLLVVAITGAARVAGLAPAAVAEQVRLDYGLSTRSTARWLADIGTAWAVQVATASLLGLLLLAMARRWPRRWWVPASAAAAAAVVVGSLLYPLVVEPLFTRFAPLRAEPLRSDLIAVARAQGLDVDEVLVAEASRRTTSLNGYVSGIAGTRRIVVYDTLVTGAPARETELVVAHEVGHAVRRDVERGTAMGALAGAGGVCLAAWALARPGTLARLGARGPGDPRLVAPALAAAVVLPLLLAPVTTVASRRIEARADLISLQATGDVDGFVAMQRRLATTNLSDPDPQWWQRALFSTHPSVLERVGVAEAYRQRSDIAP